MAKKKSNGTTTEVSTAVVEVPIAEPSPNAYAPTTLHVNIPGDLAPTWKRVVCGMQESHQRLQSGKHVDEGPAAFLSILEQIREQ